MLLYSVVLATDLSFTEHYLDILLNVFLAIAVDNLADAESLNTDEGDKKGWQLDLLRSLCVANLILNL